MLGMHYPRGNFTGMLGASVRVVYLADIFPMIGGIP